jgi:hypothetical protein
MPPLVTTCKLNQLLDAVTARLKTYVKPKVGLNLVPTPVTVKRGAASRRLHGAGEALCWRCRPRRGTSSRSARLGSRGCCGSTSNPRGRAHRDR